MSGGRFLGPGLLKEEDGVWTSLCPDLVLFGWKSWMSLSDLQFHFLHLDWDFSMAERIVNEELPTP